MDRSTPATGHIPFRTLPQLLEAERMARLEESTAKMSALFAGKAVRG